MNATAELLAELNCCILIPTYNNEKTLIRVVQEVLKFSPPERVIIVNDGSTDSTPILLSELPEEVRILHQPHNMGKGAALRRGFRHAISEGFQYALTLDSDGQHFPSDMESMLNSLRTNPGAMIMGSRNMSEAGAPGKSSFGNKFSNFWFFVETAIKLPDTQTGFRIYPLATVKKLWLLTSRFELEIEIIVKLAWRNVPFVASPVRVLYDPLERVSHFRPGMDFFRISVLNTFLVLISLIWFYPRKLISRKTWQALKQEAIKSEETNARKALSIAFGVFMGIVPIWGLQLIVGIPLAILFRMNKVLFVAAANISIPPMIPFILYLSYRTGGYFFPSMMTEEFHIENISLQMVHEHFLLYATGASIFAVFAGAATFVVSYGILKIFRKEPA